MWQYINLNPKRKSVGDCTVRAIGIATDRNWFDVYLDLCLFGMLMCDMPSSNAVTTAYLKKKGFKRYTIPEDLSEDYTVKDFCNDHPEGVYVIGIGTHMVCVIDGNYYDAWDSGDELPVYYFSKNKSSGE